MKKIKKMLKITLMTLGAIIAIAVIFVGVLTVTEYRPKDSEPLEIAAKSNRSGDTSSVTQNSSSPSGGDTLSVVTWNIGYGSLGANADFFMDGGDSVSSNVRVNDVQTLDLGFKNSDHNPIKLEVELVR